MSWKCKHEWTEPLECTWCAAEHRDALAEENQRLRKELEAAKADNASLMTNIELMNMALAVAAQATRWTVSSSASGTMCAEADNIAKE